MFFAEELDSPLVDFSPVSNVTVFIFEAGVFDPVLHYRVDYHKCRGVKDFNVQEFKKTKILFSIAMFWFRIEITHF